MSLDKMVEEEVGGGWSSRNLAGRVCAERDRPLGLAGLAGDYELALGL